MRIGDNIMQKKLTMITMLLLGVLGLLLMVSCVTKQEKIVKKVKKIRYVIKRRVIPAKKDHTPYETIQCNKKLLTKSELRGTPIDKIVVYKSKRKMYTYSHGKIIHSFPISLGKNGDEGHKIEKGDYRTPEGSYQIIQKKCHKILYKILAISYPNKKDTEKARTLGVETGGEITIHGQPKWNADGHGDAYTLKHDWTEGCIAVPNSDMDKLWMAVNNGVKIDIYP